MPLRIVCPSGHSFLAPVQLAGREVLCPVCQLVTVIPEVGRTGQENRSTRHPAPPDHSTIAAAPEVTPDSPQSGRRQTSAVAGKKGRPDAPGAQSGVSPPHGSEQFGANPVRTGNSVKAARSRDATAIPSATAAVPQRDSCPESVRESVTDLPTATLGSGRADNVHVDHENRASQHKSVERTNEDTSPSAVMQLVPAATRPGRIPVGLLLVALSPLAPVLAGFSQGDVGRWAALLALLTLLETASVILAALIPHWLSLRLTGLIFAAVASGLAAGATFTAFAPPARLEFLGLAGLQNPATRWAISLTLIHGCTAFLCLRKADKWWRTMQRLAIVRTGKPRASRPRSPRSEALSS